VVDKEQPGASVARINRGGCAIEDGVGQGLIECQIAATFRRHDVGCAVRSRQRSVACIDGEVRRVRIRAGLERGFLRVEAVLHK
jgi:hypothetical protein